MISRLTKPVKGPLELSIPYAMDNRKFLRSILGGNAKIGWDRNRRLWIIPRAKFRELYELVPKRTGVLEIELFAIHSEKKRCDTRCVNAVGFECVCECAGANHGGMLNMDDWRLVGATTLVSDGKKYSCMLYRVEIDNG